MKLALQTHFKAKQHMDTLCDKLINLADDTNYEDEEDLIIEMEEVRDQLNEKKLYLENVILDTEKLADAEKAWTLRHPHDKTEYYNSATYVLTLLKDKKAARMRKPRVDYNLNKLVTKPTDYYLYEETDVFMKDSDKPKKKVSFAPDILPPPGRYEREYRRSSIVYTPGRYACPTEVGWLNTSFLHDNYRQWYGPSKVPGKEDELALRNVTRELYSEYYPEGQGKKFCCLDSQGRSRCVFQQHNY